MYAVTVRLPEKMQARCANSFQRDLFSVSLKIHSIKSPDFKPNNPISYKYDISRVKTQKNIDVTVTTYYYDDSNNLVSMTVGDKY